MTVEEEARGLERRRDWVALLRSPSNSRSSVAADNPPRNATQVISRLAFCRSNLLSVAAGLGGIGSAALEQALLRRTRRWS